ncbi:MAG: 1-(5-phosphoribosyl)-5-[(5-phosphoribosylamino)methylideneamino]imidazole-4-carboxamide isomerase [Clostridium sp.]|nr:1-(5-phosphoribosyl)-5-[(5-phosphoribosylamino)methylideneamino]imidazole-4-carboxamide isomerase [Clostridium sp.]
MIIIPTIDIIAGNAVRLYKGDYSKKEIVEQSVMNIAKYFNEVGVDAIHMVDLDGAKEGHMVNAEIIIKVAKCVDIPIEVGGGIRNYKDIEFLIDNGVSKVILGTSAIENEQLLIKSVKNFGDKISIGIDCKNGYLCTNGWIKESSIYYIDFIKKIESIGIENVIVTDINRDGTMKGINLELIENIKNITSMKVTASGGIKDIKDIESLKKRDIYAAIVGKAVYNGNLNLKEAINVCKKDR